MINQPLPRLAKYFLLLTSLSAITPKAVIFAQATAPVNVTVTPLTASLRGGATQQFTATVANNVNTAVTWKVNGIVGGNATVGTVSASGLYQAPAVVVTTRTATVQVLSMVDPTKSAIAVVTLQAMTIAITPTTRNLIGGAQAQFTPLFTNAPSTAVTWKVNGIAGGNGTVGTVSATGLYQAPAVIVTTRTAAIQVGSQVDPAKSATAIVTLQALTLAISPITRTMRAGAYAQFTPSFTNAPSTAVTWKVNGIVGGNAAAGTVSVSGLYKAPPLIPTTRTATVQVVSQVDATKSAAATVILVPISVAVTPSVASLPGGRTLQFTANVANTVNSAVTWSVNGFVGGNTSVGTISTAGLYKAAAVVPSQTTVTVKATSQADPTKSSSATVTLLPSNITISPTTGTLIGGAAQQFTASVLNAANTSVTWQVNGVTGGNATTGTISATGLYAAPAKIVNQIAVSVTAVSQADTTKSASAQLTLVPLSVTVSPTSKTLGAGGIQQFTATVKNSAKTAVTWKVNGVAGGSASTGTISTSGLYTAPLAVSAQAVVAVTAVSQVDTSKFAAAQVTISGASVTVNPATASLGTGATQQFAAVVVNATNSAVTWKVNGVTGGSAATGTITVAGLYKSPASLSAKTVVTVSAVLQADATKYGSAQVTITPPPLTTSGSAFYVAATGNDSNLGTLAAPWKTISHAASSSTVQPGDTVYVRGGTYPETVTIGMSGSATAGPVTFQNYPGEKPIVDGSALTPPSDQHGLINIESRSYVTVAGFELRNYKTSSSSAIPAGVWVTGSGSNIKILNNIVHDIQTSSEAQGNAFGIAVYGTDAPASLDKVTIDGNQVYNLRTGGSESVNVDGNVTNFAITNNIVHDNDNIAIDAIGNEGVSSNPAYDIARNGVISDNIIYNISGKTNPGEGNDYDADGVYVDGGTQIVIERNLIHNVDIGIEAASEHRGTTSSYITIRNNVVYASNVVGISIGGYDSSVGGADHCTIVNNTLYGNDTQNSGSGEFQVQYYATNNIFKNNIVYATSQGLFINNYTNSEANPVDVDYNLYYSASGTAEFLWNGSNLSSFASYRSSTKKDPHSTFLNPLLLNLSLAALNLDVLLTSPAINKGTNLGVTVEGSLDFAGESRVQGTSIDIGAFEH